MYDRIQHMTELMNKFKALDNSRDSLLKVQTELIKAQAERIKSLRRGLWICAIISFSTLIMNLYFRCNE